MTQPLPCIHLQLLEKHKLSQIVSPESSHFAFRAGRLHTHSVPSASPLTKHSWLPAARVRTGAPCSASGAPTCGAQCHTMQQTAGLYNRQMELACHAQLCSDPGHLSCAADKLGATPTPPFLPPTHLLDLLY
jgi:hypothetical protein